MSMKLVFRGFTNHYKLCIFFALLLSMVVFLAIKKVDAHLRIDTSYSGVYIGTPAFEKILADIPYTYQESLQKIHQSLGIPVSPKMQVVILFSDHLTHNGARLRGKRRSELRSNGTILHYISFDLEFLITKRATLPEEMTHELTHAVMAEMMGLAKYDELPMWIKEGTAVHAADQGFSRIKALMRRGIDLATLGNEDEVDDGNPISLEKYVENYLRVQYLLKTFGIESFKRFIRGVLTSGNTAKELAANFRGMSTESLITYSKDFAARTLIANHRPVEAKAHFAKGKKFFDEEEFLSARLALTDALNAGLGDGDFQKAAYLLAECYIQERNPEAAFAILGRVQPNPKTIPVDRYIFLNAYTRYALGFVTEAYLLFKQAFETSGNCAVKEGALYYIIRILTEMNNFSEAGRLMSVFRAKFPQSAYIPLAAALVMQIQR